LNDRLANLDLLRGLAALAVCAGHLRTFLFVDFRVNHTPGILNRLFYFATGLGPQAVVVFFVLSGYLVGGSVFTAYQSGRWSWMKYALRRMSRLWVVLLPALVLTLLLDSLGRYLGHSAGYEGAFSSSYDSGPNPAAPADLRAITFLGNAIFLQTIEVSCFGTNAPLWSLANEFWYYTLFPLICGVAFVRSLQNRLVYALLAVALIWWLPSRLVWSGFIWVLGVGAFWAGRFKPIRRICSHPAWLVFVGSLCLGSLAASKTRSIFGTDCCIGIAFALWVIGLAAFEHRVSWLKKMSSALSEISYTLYVVHFPLLAFVFFCYFEGTKLSPGTTAYLWFGAMLIGTVAFAAAIWWCFERNTDRLRMKIELTMLRRNMSVAAEK
jgi:peptidoglycan/LPS O-acetylase OafA/YrhL